MTEARSTDTGSTETCSVEARSVEDGTTATLIGCGDLGARIGLRLASLGVAVRENTKETILKAGNARLQNSPAAEQAAALVEIAKIANLRLLDLVEEPVDQPVA